MSQNLDTKNVDLEQDEDMVESAPLVSITELWSVIAKGGKGRLGVETDAFGPMLVKMDVQAIRHLREELAIVEALLTARPDFALTQPSPDR